MAFTGVTTMSLYWCFLFSHFLPKTEGYAGLFLLYPEQNYADFYVFIILLFCTVHLNFCSRLS